MVSHETHLSFERNKNRAEEEQYDPNHEMSMSYLMEQTQKHKDSTEPSHSSQDDEQGSKREPSQTVQFIDLSMRSREQQAKNRALARSHATKSVRRAKQKRHEELRRQGLVEFTFVKGHSCQNEVNSTTDLMSIGPLGQRAEDDLKSRALFDQYFRSSTWASNSARLSHKPAIESTISALQTYKGKVTPHLHEVFNAPIWSIFYPAKHDEPPPLAVDWFSLVRSNPAAFHAACYSAATYLDLGRSSLLYSITPEIRMHKLEAIRLIKKELESCEDVPEAIIFAVMNLIREASESLGNKRPIMQSEAEVSPFKPPFILPQWQRQLNGARGEQVHIAGYRALVRMKGGIGQLRNRVLASAASYNNLIEASFEISRPPELGFYALPDVLRRAMDPTRNMPLLPRSIHRGSGLANLLAYGLTQDALAVIMEISNITVLVENYLQGALSSPDILALSCMRDQAHHKLLSLPTGAVLLVPLGASGFYECCRLAALMFETAVLYPMSRSTGIPQRLIQGIKQCVEQTSRVFLTSEGARPFFIWVLMLTGIAADGLSERQWVEEMLIDLIAVEGVFRWSEVKKIVESFLWMGFACDECAMGLWDNVSAALRGRQKVVLLA